MTQLSEKHQFVLSFIKDNVEFFAAPLWNQFLFKEWGKDVPLIAHFSQQMHEQDVIEDINEYQEALIGKGNCDRHNSLLYGSDARIIQLLKKSDKLVDFLYSFSEKESLCSIWDEYYGSHPQIVPQKKTITQSNSNLAISSSPSTSNATQKLVAQDFGLVQICRLFETNSGGLEFFSSIALVFDDEGHALSFRKALWDKFEQEKVYSINVAYSNFNKQVYPTQFIFRVIACANSDIAFQIRENELNSGDILLEELEKLIDLKGVSQHDTDYYGRIKNKAISNGGNLTKFSVLFQEPVLIKANVTVADPVNESREITP